MNAYDFKRRVDAARARRGVKQAELRLERVEFFLKGIRDRMDVQLRAIELATGGVTYRDNVLFTSRSLLWVDDDEVRGDVIRELRMKSFLVTSLPDRTIEVSWHRQG